MIIRYLFLLITVCWGVQAPLWARRSLPRPVEPVFTRQYRIEAPVDDGRKGYIQVWDRSNSQLLWTLVIFENPIDRRLEEDVQWRFIRKLKIEGERLAVTAEGGAKWWVELATKRIESAVAR